MDEEDVGSEGCSSSSLDWSELVVVVDVIVGAVDVVSVSHGGRHRQQPATTTSSSSTAASAATAARQPSVPLLLLLPSSPTAVRAKGFRSIIS